MLSKESEVLVCLVNVSDAFHVSEQSSRPFLMQEYVVQLKNMKESKYLPFLVFQMRGFIFCFSQFSNKSFIIIFLAMLMKRL